MKRGKIILMAVVILSLVSRKGYGQESPEEILLTAPLFFENRIPEELTEITELADEIVYDKIGAHVRFVPVLRLTGKDTAKPLALSDYASIPGNGYFAIQSTSVGMHPKTDHAPIEAPAFYEKISEAYDCIYTPAETKFMKYVSAAGGRAFNGLNMLLYQGVAAFELWNPGVRVEAAAIKAARRRIQELLEKGKA